MDWYHAQKHIWDCAKILWGEGQEATARWARRCCGWLWDGWTRKVLTDLARRRKDYRGRKRKALDDLHRYIQVNEEQMRYDQFRAKGYVVGSGMVEGACHHVGRPTQRLGHDLEPGGLIGDVSLADLLAQPPLGSTLAAEALGSTKIYLQT